MTGVNKCRPRLLMSQRVIIRYCQMQKGSVANENQSSQIPLNFYIPVLTMLVDDLQLNSTICCTAITGIVICNWL